MKTRFRNEADNWALEGSKIAEPSKLEAIRRTLSDEGPIIVEHWFYHRVCGPERPVFEEFDGFMTWLDEHTYAGDAIDETYGAGLRHVIRTGDWPRGSG